jgi:hypothetical protein
MRGLWMTLLGLALASTVARAAEAPSVAPTIAD